MPKERIGVERISALHQIPPIPFISTNITIHMIGENGIDVESKIIQRLDVVSIDTRETDK